MKKVWLLTFAFVIALIPFAASAQITILDSAFLYKPQESYNDCENGSCFVDAVVPNQQHRNVPIRIRFPRNTPPGRLPLILWSHGGGPNEFGREINVTWGRTLARAGYIVIHMSHFWTPEQRAAACAEFAVANEQDCLDFPMGSLFRPRDANVVLGALDWIEQNFPELADRIDRSNIAVAGWSYGSFTTMALAGSRIRFSDAFNDVSFMNPLPKAFLALSPQSSSAWGYKPDSWREITRPVLFATGAADVAQNDDPTTRRVPFQSVPRGKKYELYINHPAAIHETFNLETEMPPTFSQWLASYALAFLDGNLKNRPDGQVYLISNRLPLQGSRKTVSIYRK